MGPKLNNPHLFKLITTFFGYLGLPTLLLKRPTQKRKFSSSQLITWLWTAVFNTTILYQFAFKDPFLIKNDEWTLSGKPLSLLLYHFNGVILHFVTHAFLLLYYLFYGSDLVDELNRLLLLFSSSSTSKLTSEKTDQNEKRNAFRLFLAFQLLASVTFVLGYYVILFSYVEKCFSLNEQLLGFLTTYVDYLHFLLPLLTAHLLEYTMCQLIRSNLDKVSLENQNYDLSKEKMLPFSAIKNLSVQHCRLLKLNSTPLFVVVASNTIDALVVLALAETYIDYSYLFYVTTIFAYLLVSVYYSELTVSLLATAAGQRLHLFKVEKEDHQSHFKDFKNTTQNRHLLYMESFSVYKSYFRLKIFNLCSLTYSWMLQLMLFILNYTVLIRQTKT